MFILSRNISKAVKTAQRIVSMLHETLFIILKEKHFYLATRAERYGIRESHKVEPVSLKIEYQNGQTN